MKKAIIRFS